MGHNSLNSGGFSLRAKRVVIHKSYKETKKPINDIALIELNRTVNLTNPNVGFICLPFKHKNDNGAYPPVGTQTYDYDNKKNN
jgi:hypothetical protein